MPRSARSTSTTTSDIRFNLRIYCRDCTDWNCDISQKRLISEFTLDYMSSVAREEAATEVVDAPPRTEAAPVYRMELQPRPHVTFDESVVDNEHLGRKRSNSTKTVSRPLELSVVFWLTFYCAPECCIFHKKREFGESSSESDEDSDDSSSGDEHHRQHHAHDCKHKVRRRSRPKKRAPSPSSSDEEKMPTPQQ
jgi:hypothetical protein